MAFHTSWAHLHVFFSQSLNSAELWLWAFVSIFSTNRTNLKHRSFGSGLKFLLYNSKRKYSQHLKQILYWNSKSKFYDFEFKFESNLAPRFWIFVIIFKEMVLVNFKLYILLQNRDIPIKVLLLLCFRHNVLFYFSSFMLFTNENVKK